jgi:hypothetical protein
VPDEDQDVLNSLVGQVAHFGRQLTDFLETAALISQMDLKRIERFQKMKLIEAKPTINNDKIIEGNPRRRSFPYRPFFASTLRQDVSATPERTSPREPAPGRRSAKAKVRKILDTTLRDKCPFILQKPRLDEAAQEVTGNKWYTKLKFIIGSCTKE